MIKNKLANGIRFPHKMVTFAPMFWPTPPWVRNYFQMDACPQPKWYWTRLTASNDANFPWIATTGLSYSLHRKESPTDCRLQKSQKTDNSNTTFSFQFYTLPCFLFFFSLFFNYSLRMDGDNSYISCVLMYCTNSLNCHRARHKVLWRGEEKSHLGSKFPLDFFVFVLHVRASLVFLCRWAFLLLRATFNDPSFGFYCDYVAVRMPWNLEPMTFLTLPACTDVGK